MTGQPLGITAREVRGLHRKGPNRLEEAERFFRRRALPGVARCGRRALLQRHRLLGVGDRGVARENVVDLAGAEQLPDAIVEPRQQQAPAVPLEGRISADQHAQAARVHLADAAHIDGQGGGSPWRTLSRN